MAGNSNLFIVLCCSSIASTLAIRLTTEERRFIFDFVYDCQHCFQCTCKLQRCPNWNIFEISGAYTQCAFTTKDLNCFSPFHEDGGWTLWSQWSTCIGSCDSATRERTRSCTNPSPHNCGKHCEGSSKDVDYTCVPTYCTTGVTKVKNVDLTTTKQTTRVTYTTSLTVPTEVKTRSSCTYSTSTSSELLSTTQQLSQSPSRTSQYLSTGQPITESASTKSQFSSSHSAGPHYQSTGQPATDLTSSGLASTKLQYSSSPSATPHYQSTDEPATDSTISSQSTSESPVTSASLSYSVKPTAPFAIGSCEYYCSLNALITQEKLTNTRADVCPDGTHSNGDALPMSCCNMKEPTTWTTGQNVMQNCDTLRKYNPIASFSNGVLMNDTSGILLGCLDEGHGFQMLRQSCDQPTHLVRVVDGDSASPDSYFVINSH